MLVQKVFFLYNQFSIWQNFDHVCDLHCKSVTISRHLRHAAANLCILRLFRLAPTAGGSRRGGSLDLTELFPRLPPSLRPSKGDQVAASLSRGSPSHVPLGRYHIMRHPHIRRCASWIFLCHSIFLSRGA